MQFWNKTHPLSALADTLQETYIPASGATQYVEAEVFRAVSNIHYDYYNNGFGNNMSQAVAYIEAYHTATPEFLAAFAPIKKQALEPTNQNLNDDDFDTIVAEIISVLDAASTNNTLTPIDKEIFDMPAVETIYMDDDWWGEDEEEYKY